MERRWGRRALLLAVVSSQQLLWTRAAGVQAPSQCGGVNVAEWLSDEWRASGYHLLCLNEAQGCAQAGDDEGACQASDRPTSVGCWRGHSGSCEDFVLEQGSATSLFELEAAIAKQASLQNPKRYNRIKTAKEKKGKKFGGIFGFYTVDPATGLARRLKDGAELSGLVLAFEGASFIWPGVKIGFRRNVTLPAEGSAGEVLLELLTRSLKPLVIEVSSFLSDDECRHIIDKASPHIAKSAVSHMDHDVGKPDTNWRSSSTYFMRSDDDTLKRLDARVANLVANPRNHQEFAQVLRYEKNERYAAHHDYFDPAMYQKNEQIMGMTKKGLFNRLATVFFYLTTVDKGGQTNFPRAGGLPQPRNFEDCSNGVSVEPVQGRIIIFYSLDPSAAGDEYSLHGGCAVEEGTKWSANKWIWNQPMGFV